MSVCVCICELCARRDEQAKESARGDRERLTGKGRTGGRSISVRCGVLHGATSEKLREFLQKFVFSCEFFKFAIRNFSVKIERFVCLREAVWNF